MSTTAGQKVLSSWNRWHNGSNALLAHYGTSADLVTHYQHSTHQFVLATFNRKKKVTRRPLWVYGPASHNRSANRRYDSATLALYIAV